MPLVFSGIRLFSFAFARFAGYNRDGVIAYDFFLPGSYNRPAICQSGMSMSKPHRRSIWGMV